MSNHPICFECIHFNLNWRTTPGGLRCDAFPDGIPMEIELGRFNHRKPFPGDNGIMFEQVEPPRLYRIPEPRLRQTEQP